MPRLLPECDVKLRTAAAAASMGGRQPTTIRGRLSQSRVESSQYRRLRLSLEQGSLEWERKGEVEVGTRKGSGLNDNVERGKAAAELDPDVQLMLRVREDDAMAFQQLVQAYQLRLLRVLKHMVGSTTAAEDLVQDVFLRVWRARHNYVATAKFSTWIFHIAHNVASNAIRDRQRKKEVQVSGNPDYQDGALSLEQMAVASTGMIPIRKLDKSERADMVRTAVEALNERQRTALLLSKFEGLSYQEIADTMELSVQAVKSLLSRARVNLKTLLEPYLDEGMIPGSEAGPTHD
jgi:RNA polymerase sigma-70 factor, ECF subfamily